MLKSVCWDLLEEAVKKNPVKEMREKTLIFPKVGHLSKVWATRTKC